MTHIFSKRDDDSILINITISLSSIRKTTWPTGMFCLFYLTTTHYIYKKNDSFIAMAKKRRENRQPVLIRDPSTLMSQSAGQHFETRN